MNLKNINKQNYPPIMVLWVATTLASTFYGIAMASFTLTMVGAATILLAAAYVLQMPNPNRSLLK